MPRIYDRASSPIDLCRSCFKKKYPTEEQARKEFGGGEDGPDGRGDCFSYNEEHPDYQGEGYECWECRKTLTDFDN